MAFQKAMPDLAKLGEVEIFEGLLQIAHTAMHEFGAAGGGAGGKIIALHEDYLQPAQGSVERAACTGCPASNDAEIELLRGEAMKGFGAG